MKQLRRIWKPLLMGCCAIAIAATPIPTLAQTENPKVLLPALEGINLTAQQQTTLDQIRQQTRTQLQNILSVDQRNQFYQTLQQGGDLRAAIAATNLSSSQKTEVKQVLQSARRQLASTLTPQQRQQVLQNIRQLWGHNLATP